MLMRSPFFKKDATLLDSMFEGFLLGDGLLPLLKPHFLSDFSRDTRSIIREEDGGFSILIAIPGFEREEVEVGHDGKAIVVEAKKATKEEKSKEGGDLGSGDFGVDGLRMYYKQVFSLPNDVDSSSVKAELRNGILKITIPKIEKKREKIRIDVS